MGVETIRGGANKAAPTWEEAHAVDLRCQTGEARQWLERRQRERVVASMNATGLAPGARVRILHVDSPLRFLLAAGVAGMAAHGCPPLRLRTDTGTVTETIGPGHCLVRLDAPAHWQRESDHHYDLPELVVSVTDLEMLAT